MTPQDLAARLNRHAPAASRWSFGGSAPFGGELTIERWELANGLEVLLVADPTAPVIAYHTWYRVGSSYETPGKTGLAHFFEHMMFNETESLRWGEFDRRMEEAGGETNAATWIDWTYYHEVLPADELPLAVELEADRMKNLVVRRAQVDSEREVVANERRMAVEDDVEGAADERLHALAFGRSHPHGWPTIGWMQDIEGYRVADCRRFYRTWYAPNNATVVIAGAVEREEALTLIQRAYGPHKPSRSLASPRPGRPRQRKERRARMSWPTPSQKLSIGWHAPPYLDGAYPVVEVIDELLTGGRSGRLRRRLVDELEIVSELRGSVAGLRHGGLFQLWVSMREGLPVERALSVIDEEVLRLCDEPLPARELERVKARAELFTLGAVETANGKAGQIGFSRTVAGDPAHTFARLDELASVTADDVRRVAREWLVPNRRSMVYVMPSEAR